MAKVTPGITQVAIGLGFLLVTGGIALWHRHTSDIDTSAKITGEQSEAVAQLAIRSYWREPFGFTAHIRHYETVRDVPDRGTKTRRIYALGAERLTAYNNRLALIQANTQANAEPTKFLTINIDRQERALSEFIGKNAVLPPGSKVAREYAEMTLELELWLRAEQLFQQQTSTKPLPQNPQSLTQ
jgi:hypothetical protein